MTFFLENIGIWIFLGVIFLVTGFMFFQSSRHGKVLGIFALLAVLCWGLGSYFVYGIQTDRKKIRQTIENLAKAVEENNVEKVLSFLAIDAESTRTQASTHLKQSKIEWTKVRDFKIQSLNHTTSPATAHVSFLGTVKGKASQYENAPFTVLIRFADVELLQEEDSNWYVTDRCTFTYPGYQGGYQGEYQTGYQGRER